MSSSESDTPLVKGAVTNGNSIRGMFTPSIAPVCTSELGTRGFNQHSHPYLPPDLQSLNLTLIARSLLLGYTH